MKHREHKTKFQFGCLLNLFEIFTNVEFLLTLTRYVTGMQEISAMTFIKSSMCHFKFV